MKYGVSSWVLSKIGKKRELKLSDSVVWKSNQVNFQKQCIIVLKLGIECVMCVLQLMWISQFSIFHRSWLTVSLSISLFLPSPSFGACKGKKCVEKEAYSSSNKCYLCGSTVKFPGVKLLSVWSEQKDAQFC